MPELQAFAGTVDLAEEDLGARALWASDDFFASKDNLLKRAPARFDPDAYGDEGKIMDGWESRRERVPGDDMVIVKLACPGVLVGVDVDTSHFLGNHPPFASLDACLAPPDSSAEQLRDQVDWTPLLTSVPLQRGSHNLFALPKQGADSSVYSHVRLRIHPDGGVARLRIHGHPAGPPPEGEHDLAGLLHGGRAIACSDMFFSPMDNLLRPGRSTYMGGGWETRRSRPPGMDWIIVALSAPGVVRRLTLDTGWFKGNFPDQAAVDAIYWPAAPAHALVEGADWTEILPPTRMRADREHHLETTAAGPWTHLRLRILPDGGMARLRAWGERQDARPDGVLAALNALDPAAAAQTLSRCCGARRWVAAMVAGRPYGSRAQLHGQARVAWWSLGEADWRQAFTHHPRIGADVDKLRESFGSTATWSQGEQAGVAAAEDTTLQALAAGNRAYEARFGHIFIVCASGLSAEQMLARLEDRLDNTAAAELRIAAGEQARITALRLTRLLADPKLLESP